MQIFGRKRKKNSFQHNWTFKNYFFLLNYANFLSKNLQKNEKTTGNCLLPVFHIPGFIFRFHCQKSFAMKKAARIRRAKKLAKIFEERTTTIFELKKGFKRKRKREKICIFIVNCLSVFFAFVINQKLEAYHSSTPAAANTTASTPFTCCTNDICAYEGGTAVAGKDTYCFAKLFTNGTLVQGSVLPFF